MGGVWVGGWGGGVEADALSTFSCAPTNTREQQNKSVANKQNSLTLVKGYMKVNLSALENNVRAHTPAMVDSRM